MSRCEYSVCINSNAPDYRIQRSQIQEERTLHYEKRDEYVDGNSEETGRQSGDTQKRDTGILVVFS